MRDETVQHNGKYRTHKNDILRRNKSSAVAEMDDRLATIGMNRKWGGAAEGAGSPYWIPI